LPAFIYKSTWAVQSSFLIPVFPILFPVVVLVTPYHCSSQCTLPVLLFYGLQACCCYIPILHFGASLPILPGGELYQTVWYVAVTLPGEPFVVAVLLTVR